MSKKKKQEAQFAVCINNEGYEIPLTKLPGKTLATCTEQPSDFIAQTDTLNAIISGETITVERKFEHPYDFNPTVKLCGR